MRSIANQCKEILQQARCWNWDDNIRLPHYSTDSMAYKSICSHTHTHAQASPYKYTAHPQSPHTLAKWVISWHCPHSAHASCFQSWGSWRVPAPWQWSCSAPPPALGSAVPHQSPSNKYTCRFVIGHHCCHGNGHQCALSITMTVQNYYATLQLTYLTIKYLSLNIIIRKLPQMLLKNLEDIVHVKCKNEKSWNINTLNMSRVCNCPFSSSYSNSNR